MSLSYIFPYLIYCIEVWGNASSHCHLLPLFLTQKKIIRLITFSKHLAHTEPIFKSLNIIPLNSLNYHRIRLLMYKLSNGLFPEALNELYIKRNKIHNYPTRNCDKYHIQTSTDSFSNVSARIWNVIKTNIDVNISFMQFKIVLKLYLHENEVILKYMRSPVYVIFIDASKAFDRLSHIELFDILSERNMCPLIRRLLFNLYGNQQFQIR